MIYRRSSRNFESGTIWTSHCHRQINGHRVPIILSTQQTLYPPLNSLFNALKNSMSTCYISENRKRHIVKRICRLLSVYYTVKARISNSFTNTTGNGTSVIQCLGTHFCEAPPTLPYIIQSKQSPWQATYKIDQHKFYGELETKWLKHLRMSLRYKHLNTVASKYACFGSR